MEKKILYVIPVGGDIYKWKVIIRGPKGTPYESGNFELEVLFPENYPFGHPKVRFITKFFHVNINYKGEICSNNIVYNFDMWAPK